MNIPLETDGWGNVKDNENNINYAHTLFLFSGIIIILILLLGSGIYYHFYMRSNYLIAEYTSKDNDVNIQIRADLNHEIGFPYSSSVRVKGMLAYSSHIFSVDEVLSDYFVISEEANNFYVISSNDGLVYGIYDINNGIAYPPYETYDKSTDAYKSSLALFLLLKNINRKYIDYKLHK